MEDESGFLNKIINRALLEGGSLIVERRGQDYEAKIGRSMSLGESPVDAIFNVCILHIHDGGSRK